MACGVCGRHATTICPQCKELLREIFSLKKKKMLKNGQWTMAWIQEKPLDVSKKV